jgi:hypothetical protein
VALGVGVSLTRAGGTLPRLERSSLTALLRLLDPVIEALRQPPA